MTCCFHTGKIDGLLFWIQEMVDRGEVLESKYAHDVKEGPTLILRLKIAKTDEGIRRIGKAVWFCHAPRVNKSTEYLYRNAPAKS